MVCVGNSLYLAVLFLVVMSNAIRLRVKRTFSMLFAFIVYVTISCNVRVYKEYTPVEYTKSEAFIENFYFDYDDCEMAIDYLFYVGNDLYTGHEYIWRDNSTSIRIEMLDGISDVYYKKTNPRVNSLVESNVKNSRIKTERKYVVDEILELFSFFCFLSTCVFLLL